MGHNVLTTTTASAATMNIDSLEDFARAAGEACLNAPAGTSAVFVVDDGEGCDTVTCIDVAEGGALEHAEAEIADAIAGVPVRFAALGSATRWSPAVHVPFGPAWSLVCVSHAEPPLVLVGRVDLEQWWRIPLQSAAPFQLLTAAGLRSALDGTVPDLRRLGGGPGAVRSAPTP